jgi:hypothetical protein
VRADALRQHLESGHDTCLPEPDAVDAARPSARQHQTSGTSCGPRVAQNLTAALRDYQPAGLQLNSDWEGTRRRYWVERVGGGNVKSNGTDDTEHPFIAPVASLTQRGLIQVAPAPGLPARQAAHELHFAAAVLEWTAGHQR